MALTDQQKLALDIIPRITGMMSMLGSLFVMYLVLKSPQKRTMAYHLQMLALSCADFLFLHFGLYTIGQHLILEGVLQMDSYCF